MGFFSVQIGEQSNRSQVGKQRQGCLLICTPHLAVSSKNKLAHNGPGVPSALRFPELNEGEERRRHGGPAFSGMEESQTFLPL